MNRTAVVTGAAGGIGSAIVGALTAAGHDVAFLASDAAGAITGQTLVADGVSILR